MNSKKLNELAILAAKSNTIPADISEFVLNYLSKQELKTFLKNYKNALDNKRVYITASSNLGEESLKSLKNIFKNKDLILNIDQKLGAGIKVRDKDMITDFTFKNYIDETINSLKD